jgi:hypothetical protein
MARKPGSSIVTYEHRYKRPPRKKKPVAIEGPAVVRTAAPKAEAPAPWKSAIVTIRKRGSDVPDLTPEEHRRRGDAAVALFRKMKRRIAERIR